MINENCELRASDTVFRYNVILIVLKYVVGLSSYKIKHKIKHRSPCWFSRKLRLKIGDLCNFVKKAGNVIKFLEKIFFVVNY